MKKLSEVLDMTLLQSHLDNKLINKRTHPDYPELSIYNYSTLQSFSHEWDEVVSQCRGLITVIKDGDEYVLARGFNKFHNLNTSYIPETLEENLPNEEPIVTTKLDGSMGIIFWYDNKVHVATRGSFSSDQAQWATKWLRNHLTSEDLYTVEYLMSSYIDNPIVEIIYKDNRIVVSYEQEKLFLIGQVYIDTGKELTSNRSKFVASTSFKLDWVKIHNKSLKECSLENTPNEEGYVLTYPSTGLKVKIKFEDYCRLHKVITGLNLRSIWELLSQGKELEHLETFPKEFQSWYHSQVNYLSARFTGGSLESLELFRRLKELDLPSRKDQALWIRANGGIFQSVLFTLLDGKNADQLIWKLYYPKGTEVFRQEGE